MNACDRLYPTGTRCFALTKPLNLRHRASSCAALDTFAPTDSAQALASADVGVVPFVKDRSGLIFVEIERALGASWSTVKKLRDTSNAAAQALLLVNSPVT